MEEAPPQAIEGWWREQYLPGNFYISWATPTACATLMTIRKKISGRLLDLKHDKARLKEYDTGEDGKISSGEWDVARDDIEEEIPEEQLNRDTNRDEVAIGAHPPGRVFWL